MEHILILFRHFSSALVVTKIEKWNHFVIPISLVLQMMWSLYKLYSISKKATLFVIIINIYGPQNIIIKHNLKGKSSTFLTISC